MKKILLIGDSTRMGYDKYVKMAFEDVAEVYYPNDNCRFAGYVMRHTVDWKKTLCNNEDVDCVHWNAGLWDCLIFHDGEYVTPIDIYKYYFERACREIKRLFPSAKVVFATSTPVVEERFIDCKRYNKDIEAYNSVAVKIAKEYGFEINDLYETIKGSPAEYYTDSTHLYTKEGTQLLSDKVIKTLEDTLNIKAKELDYDKLFDEKKDVIGI